MNWGEDRGEDRGEDPRWVTIVGWIARALVGGVFIYAGAIKLLDPVGFAETIGNYQAFPHWTWNLAATVVPVTEILAGLAVLTNFKRRGGAIVLFALTLAFVGLVTSVMIRDIDLACGCFGEASKASEVGWPLLLRDLGLLVAIVAAYLPGEPARDASNGEPHNSRPPASPS